MIPAYDFLLNCKLFIKESVGMFLYNFMVGIPKLGCYRSTQINTNFSTSYRNHRKRRMILLLNNNRTQDFLIYNKMKELYNFF